MPYWLIDWLMVDFFFYQPIKLIKELMITFKRLQLVKEIIIQLVVWNNWPKTDGAYVINLDEYRSIDTHWIALRVNGDNVTYFDSFGVEHIPKQIKNS